MNTTPDASGFSPYEKVYGKKSMSNAESMTADLGEVPPGSRSAPSSGSNSVFDIQLVFEGQSVVQQVSANLPVVYLAYEASRLFGINPDSVQLMSFSLVPTMLDRASTLLGPP